MFIIQPDKRKDYGPQAQRRIESLLNLMNYLIDAPEEIIVIRVNRFFNQLEYSPDTITWRKKDYWASRLEFLGKGQGDCEDFAVAKFLTLKQLGVPQEKLFLTYVKAIGYPEAAHLVVSYYRKPETAPFVLDNFNKRVLILSRRKDLVPVYSFTETELYLQKQDGLGKRINRKPLTTQVKLRRIENDKGVLTR